MNYVEAKHRLDRSATLRLLKADSAALCIPFLRDVFRVDRAIHRAQPEMIARLTTVLDEINGPGEAKKFPREAKDYLDKWLADGALVTRYDDNAEVVYELTPAADEAILFFQQLGEHGPGTRGAESKLRTVLQSLERIKQGANPDRAVRLREIEERIAALQKEKGNLLAADSIQPDSPDKLLEEYHFALEMAHSLLADFTRIRQRFLEVAQELAERYASADISRGALLERALAAHNELRTGPLGQSFFGFREYLAADETQSRLSDLIEQLEQIPVFTEIMSRDRFLPRVPQSLIAEAQAVVQQTRRLSSDLRRMLDATAITSRREAHEAVANIKALLYSASDAPPVADLMEAPLPFAEIELAEATLRLPWKAPDVIVPVGESQADPNEASAGVLKLFADLSIIDLGRLTAQVQERFRQEDHGFRLTEMLDWFPPKRGEWLLDVIGYLELARRPKSSFVLRDRPEDYWEYCPPGGERSYRLPQVYFYK
ncbi:MAG: DUF3375 family protein [Opitutaceae bacterium]|nr:DUF3375 family protein [Opitutaceae bacterium]